MLTADGGFVRAVPDQYVYTSTGQTRADMTRRQWKKEAAAKPRTLTGAEVRDQEPLDAALTCAICKKLVWEAVRTPCCDSAFCEECITTRLVEHAFECPVCESKVASLDKLRPDEELREKVKGYVDGEIERSKKEEKEEKERDGDGEAVKVGPAFVNP
jgi:protein MPE1